MNTENSHVRGFLRRRPLVRPRMAFLVAAGVLVPVCVCLAAVIIKINVVRTGTLNTARISVDTGFASSGSSTGSTAGVLSCACDPVVAALVVPPLACIDIVEVTQNAVVLDEAIDFVTFATTGEDLLTDAMAAKVRPDGSAIFDPVNADLAFATLCPTKCTGSFEVVVTYEVWDICDDPIVVDTLIAGGTNEADLIKANATGQALANFEWVEAPIIDVTVPTTSAWGVVVMALLLLIGARTYFGRRARIQSIE